MRKTTANKESSNIAVLLNLRAFCPASWFVKVGKFAAPQSGTFHACQTSGANKFDNGTFEDQKIEFKDMTIRNEKAFLFR